VSEESLKKLGVGFATDLGPPCWTFPEKNEDGLVVGITRRLVTPQDGKSKLFCKGSRRGLTFCDDWDARPGCIFLVEGASDVAAALSLGVNAIGRPNNTGGVEMLAKLLRRTDRKIIVMGENDKKDTSTMNPQHDPNCKCCARCWPGGWGARQTARELSKRLGRRIGVVFPRKKFKDLREVVASLEEEDWYEYGAILSTGLFPPANWKGARAGQVC
jgi:uncharacterized protein (DUF2126 family)